MFCSSRRFPRRRWHAGLLLPGNANVLNALLYRGQFPTKNLPGSAYQNYVRIFSSLFANVLARESFFLQMLLLGRLAYPSGYPLEVDAATFVRAKAALADVEVHTVHGDVFETVRRASVPADFVSLSDVPSFLEGEAERTFMGDIRAYVAAGATVVYRGHLRVAQPHLCGYEDRSDLYQELARCERTQLWNARVLHAA